MTNASGHELFVDSTSYNGADDLYIGNTVHYIEGNTTGIAGQWTGTDSRITELYEGLTVAYKIGIDGAATTTLKINNLDAKTVYRNNSKLTTHLPVNTVVILVYDGTYWRWADYDANTDTKVRIYKENTASELPIIASRTAAGSITSGSTAVYGIIPSTAENIPTMNPSTGVLTVPSGIVANLTGNASTATNASTAAIATKVGHTLTIGTYIFDGSADVSIPVYSGIIA